MNNNGNKIARLIGFTEYLKNNVEIHVPKAINSDNLEEIENSILLLRDYTDVLDEMMKAIDNYCNKTGYEG